MSCDNEWQDRMDGLVMRYEMQQSMQNKHEVVTLHCLMQSLMYIWVTNGKDIGCCVDSERQHYSLFGTVTESAGVADLESACTVTGEVTAGEVTFESPSED